VSGSLTDQAIAELFFEKAIVKYNAGDVKFLLSVSDLPAGPLLTVTANGIDIMGGICWGFCTGSRERSVRFMEEHMTFSRPEADLIYQSARCGISHEGMPKKGIEFFHQGNVPRTSAVLYKQPSTELLYMNVTEFAHRYLDAVEAIGRDKKSHVRHYPTLDSRVDFEAALAVVTGDIGNLCQQFGEKWEGDYRKRTGQGTSSSCYMPDNTLHITLKVGPEP
jgi:hypothetical protein